MAAPLHSCRLRTISYFLPRLCDTLEEWEAEIVQAAEFLKQGQELFEQHGYEVQTVRVVTRALSAVASAAEAATLAANLEWLCLAHGISFLSLGATSNVALLQDGVFSLIAAGTRHTSCSFSWQPGMGQREAQVLAAAIHGLEEGKHGACFRFCTAFNCQPGIPFFPVASAPAQESPCWAIGTENSGLLHAAFKEAAEAAASGGNVLDCAQDSLRLVMASALEPVEALAQQLAAATGHTYLGIDASIAPALEPPSIGDAYELLGLGRFGLSGTLAISERITAALKSLPLRLCGYSGLMLPVCEDAGLAAAANEGRISISSLLHFSAVCGCGLDTVPVPGATQQQPAEERKALLDATAAVLLDVAAMAFRLGKPLSARLLPVPGGRAGQRTAFDSPFLLNCAVLPLV